ncbi:MAG: response regulator [Myxococcales bacterium]|nr:response regulator [Myxococcales bacterium]
MVHESERCFAQVRLCWRADGSLDVVDSSAEKKSEIEAYTRSSGLFRRFLFYRRCFREGEHAKVEHDFWSPEGWASLEFELKKENGDLFVRFLRRLEDSECMHLDEPKGLVFSLGDNDLRLYWKAEQSLPWEVGELLQGNSEGWMAFCRECLRSFSPLIWEDERGGGALFFLEPQFDEWGWASCWAGKWSGLDMATRRSDLAQQTLQMRGMSFLVRGLVHDINNFLTGVMANLSMARLLLSDQQEAAPFLEAAEDSSAKMGDSMQELAFLSWSPTELKGNASLEACLEPWIHQTQVPLGLSVHWEKQLFGFQVALEPALVKDILTWALRFFGRFGGCEQVQLVVRPCWRIEPLKGATERVFLSFVFEAEPQKPLPSSEYGELFWPYIELDGRRQFSPLSRAWVTLRGLHGWIEAESIDETFRLHLHFPALVKSPELEKEAEPQTVKRVLLMDDEPMVRESVATTLQALGYEVESAESGESALLLFQEARQAGRIFHLALLDLSVHGGMDGLETGRQLRALDPSLRLVLLSGYETEHHQQEDLEACFDARMQKPFRIASLARLLEEVLRRPAK